MSKTTSSNSNRFIKLLPYFILLAVCFSFIYPYIYDKKLSAGGDSISYYILGKSIAQGDGYTNIHTPNQEAHTHFPPGYPLLISGFMKLGINDVDQIKTINGILLLISSIVLFLILLKLEVKKWIAFASSLAVLLNYHLLSYGNIMMSEIPFLLFSLLTLLFFINSYEEKKPLRHYSIYLVILFSAYAYHIRTAGVVLILSLLITLLSRKKWLYSITYIGGVVLLSIPWYIRNSQLGTGSYIKQLSMVNPYRVEMGYIGVGDFFTRIYENFLRYLGKEIPNSIFNLELSHKTPIELSHMLIGIGIVAVAIFGIIKIKKHKWLIIWYLAGTFGLVLLWPKVWYGIRFMLPVVPLLLFLFIYGGYHIIALAVKTLITSKPLNPIFSIALCAMFIPNVTNLHEKASFVFNQDYQAYMDLGKWIDRNLPENANISCRKPTLLYLYANRSVSRFPDSPDYNDVLDNFVENKINFVIVDELGFSSTDLYLKPVIQTNPEKFKLAYQIPNTNTLLLAFNDTYGYRGEWEYFTSDDPKKVLFGKRKGYGTYTHTDGRIFRGEWSDNKPNGKGELIFPNGKIITGDWVNGDYVQDGLDPAPAPTEDVKEIPEEAIIQE